MSKKTTEANSDIVRWGKEQDGYSFPVYRAEVRMCDNKILLLRLEKNI